jgi:hypothetical protein
MPTDYRGHCGLLHQTVELDDHFPHFQPDSAGGSTGWTKVAGKPMTATAAFVMIQNYIDLWGSILERSAWVSLWSALELQQGHSKYLCGDVHLLRLKKWPCPCNLKWLWGIAQPTSQSVFCNKFNTGRVILNPHLLGQHNTALHICVLVTCCQHAVTSNFMYVLNGLLVDL